HWANADQYYIKTGEHFNDYRYKSGGVTVRFELTAADTEQNNVKGERRFFVPRAKEAAYDEEARTLTVPFEYRPLTAKEKTAFGTGKTQDKIIEGTVEELPARFQKHPDALAALVSERRRNGKGELVGLLAHHLGRYARRNTSDYFVHKDLKGFLEGELDFYLKNEVLDVDDLEAWGPDRSESWFEVMRALKRVGRGIIAFLAQIEDFQKKLFEKKKLVVYAEYCVTLDRVPEDLYAEIATNDAQREEWKKLFAIHEIEENITQPGYSEPLTEDFLKANPFLPLDTKHFGEDLKDRLLASIEDLDEATDGLLIESENFQALNLLQERYREQVKCIYIDPPFNTGDDGFVYKHSYQHSSWLTLIRSNLEFSKRLLSNSGSFFAHIDDNELGYLLALTDTVLARENKIAVVAFKQSSVSGPKAMNPGLANTSSFVLWYAKDKNHWTPFRVYVPTKRDDRYNNFIANHSAHYSEWQLTTLRKALAESVGISDGQLKAHFGNDLEKQLEKFVLDSPDKVVQSVLVNPKDVNAEARKQLIKSKEDPGTVYRLPRDDREDYYFRSGKQLAFYSSKVREINGRRTTAEPASTIWTDLLSNNIHAEGGVSFDKGKKPAALLRRVVELSAKLGGIVLDSFAGSGTTGHAVIDLNRADGGDRKYILVEMGEYFETVLKPRILKVIYSQDWKDGRPVSRQGSSHILKYVKLESYEDALNNIAFTDREAGQEALGLYGDDYLLRYMLDFETRGSDTLLNVEKLASPFRYTLSLRRGDGETPEATVDLPETFAYLIGMRVGSRRAYRDGDRRYLVYRGSTPERGEVAAIWRDTGGWGEADFERDRVFVEQNGLAGGADEVFVNGDSFIPGARPLDGVFKERMLASP
ncbi:MAG: site-specific DNA-methyltransferase, partial [Actinomycetota bacterium]|nr:site-specific DNA-methyltransferase [Actinomycetota bacterium]